MHSNEQTLRRARRPFVAALLLAIPLSAGGCKGPPEAPPAHDAHDAHGAHPPAAPDDHAKAGGNAVQAEMRLLTSALRESVSALGDGNLDAIPTALHRVHRARDATDRALESGAYTLKKNASDLKEFQALDEAFHGELEKLLEKATANDAAATATQLGVVLSKCGGCHSRFRP